MPKKYFLCLFYKYFLNLLNPHSVFIVYNNFFAFAHAIIFCVYLYIFKDSCFRIAEILKMPQGTVSSKLHRCLEKLKKTIERGEYCEVQK